MNTNNTIEKKKHKHLWKYIEDGEARICEYPFWAINDTGCRQYEKKTKGDEFETINHE